MMGSLLIRGMLVGLVAGLLTFAFLKAFGEPQVDRAIAFETRMEAAHADAAEGPPASHQHGDEEELVSRSSQAGIGLFTGVTVYCTAFGGLFALAFALCYGRMGHLGPRATSAVLAGLGIVAVYLVPSLKYPANPPAVGDADTIGMRTALYFAAMALSLAAMIACAMLRNRLVPARGGWNASLLAGAIYLGAMVALAVLLPAVNEVPADFPADTLWGFRMAAMGAQLILWTTLGVLFGSLTHRVAARQGTMRLGAAVV